MMPEAKKKRPWDSVDAMIDHETKKLARRNACMRIRNTVLGPRAQEEGWLHGLIDFVVIKGRMPDAEEQAKLQRLAGRIEYNIDTMPLIKPQPKVKGWGTLGGTLAHASLKQLRAAMLKRAEREFFGQAPKASEPEPVPDAYAEAMEAAPERIKL